MSLFMDFEFEPSQYMDDCPLDNIDKYDTHWIDRCGNRHKISDIDCNYIKAIHALICNEGLVMPDAVEKRYQQCLDEIVDMFEVLT